jgi:hydrogenase expression/formation protein HypC
MCLGIPGQIVEIKDADRQIAIAEVSGVRREVNVACVLEHGALVESCIGYWVLVHVGFAMSRIDEEEAEKTLAILEELGEVDEELAAMQESQQALQG